MTTAQKFKATPTVARLLPSRQVPSWPWAACGEQPHPRLIQASEQWPIVVLSPLPGPQYALLASCQHAVEDQAHTTALSWSHVRGRTGKTKAKMSASTKQNSDKHMSGAQSNTGVHQAFINGYQGASIKHSLMHPTGREYFHTHNVKGSSIHMVVSLPNFRSIFFTAKSEIRRAEPWSKCSLVQF